MNRINQLFETKERDILSVYFTAGYPNLTDTLPVLQALQNNGVDMAEIGIPFSDPMADGPVIQASSSLSLRNGMTLQLLFEQLKEVREKISIPLVLMGYLNPVMQFGFEAFCRCCAETGIDGIIIPDLPFRDYVENYKPTADRYNVKMIMLITPETTDERVKLIDEYTDGFIYVVSSAATTGAQQVFGNEQQAYFKRVQDMKLKNPLMVGFGISNKATFDAARQYARGTIVGSKFISLLSETQNIDTATSRLIKELKG
jgi:tryptophan synthase, alpha subunit